MKKYYTNKTECPKCGHRIEVSDSEYHRVIDEIERIFESRLEKEKKKYRKRSDEIERKYCEADKHQVELKELLYAEKERIKKEEIDREVERDY